MTDPVIQQQETVTKQKNPLRVERGRRLVEHNCRKKEELKQLNEQITKQYSVDHKLSSDTSNYVYGGGLRLLVGTSCIVNLRNQNKP